MRNNYPIAYCMNVYPTMDFDGLCNNISQNAVAIRNELKNLGEDREFSLGLWIPADVAFSMEHRQVGKLRDVLEQNQFSTFTMNGFPFGNFHQPVVKKEVYKPTWAEQQRVEYTLRLAEILHQLMSAGTNGTISTLPLGWPSDTSQATQATSEEFQQFSENLIAVSNSLNDLAEQSDRNISVCIEPEPGCILDSAKDIISFFVDWLFAAHGDHHSRHLKVCHDVCHSAVMREDQAEVISSYRNSGIEIGKVQVSAAPLIQFQNDGKDRERIDQLRAFAEPKYLHQTSTDADGLIEDLGPAMETCEFRGRWISHFHVPVYLESMEALGTTQSDIFSAMKAFDAESETQFEIETYAWGVLPQNQSSTIEEGIAREIQWFYDSFGDSLSDS